MHDRRCQWSVFGPHRCYAGRSLHMLNFSAPGLLLQFVCAECAIKGDGSLHYVVEGPLQLVTIHRSYPSFTEHYILFRSEKLAPPPPYPLTSQLPKDDVIILNSTMSLRKKERPWRKNVACRYVARVDGDSAAR